MENLQLGDILFFIGDDIEKKLVREEVRGIAGNVIFSRTINETGTSATQFLGDIEDLKTMGWNIEIY